MREVERVGIVNLINDVISKKEELLKIQERLKSLENEELVKEYINLTKEMNNLRFNYNSEDNTVVKVFSDIMLNNDVDCSHNIWIYKGSYKLVNNYVKLCKDESDKDFIFNKYMCLECGYIVTKYDYQDFEENNQVLRNNNIILDDNYYRNYYYNCLYKVNEEKALSMLKEKFRENELVRVRR